MLFILFKNIENKWYPILSVLRAVLCVLFGKKINHEGHERKFTKKHEDHSATTFSNTFI